MTIFGIYVRFRFLGCICLYFCYLFFWMIQLWRDMFFCWNLWSLIIFFLKKPWFFVVSWLDMSFVWWCRRGRPFDRPKVQRYGGLEFINNFDSANGEIFPHGARGGRIVHGVEFFVKAISHKINGMAIAYLPRCWWFLMVNVGKYTYHNYIDPMGMKCGCSIIDNVTFQHEFVSIHEACSSH